jgi:hypothetical protein
MATSNADATIKEAKAHIGLREDPIGSNDGRALRNYLSGTDFQPGQAWCLYFAETAVKNAWPKGSSLPTQILWTGSTESLRAHAAKLGKLIPTTQGISKGSIMLLLKPSGVAHHAGIVVGEGAEPGTIYTIEGNTNNDGSVEGYEVLLKTRHISDLIVQVVF